MIRRVSEHSREFLPDAMDASAAVSVLVVIDSNPFLAEVSLKAYTHPQKRQPQKPVVPAIERGDALDDSRIQGVASLFLVDRRIKFRMASVSLAVSHCCSKFFSWAIWAIAIRARRW